jgi:hypothetical protein
LYYYCIVTLFCFPVQCFSRAVPDLWASCNVT